MSLENKLRHIISLFDPIGLDQMEPVRLMRRIDTKFVFLEVKRKNNKGEIIKNRIERKGSHNISACSSSKKFIGAYSPYNSEFLNPTLGNSFMRVTLVNKNFKERITLDYKIKFTDLKFNLHHINNDTCIAEIKTERDTKTQSPFLKKLNEMRIKTGFSKYCMGLVI